MQTFICCSHAKLTITTGKQVFSGVFSGVFSKNAKKIVKRH
ncbi:hypothetical protein V6Z11_A05G318500 [Gossypium hirsutum]